MSKLLYYEKTNYDMVFLFYSKNDIFEFSDRNDKWTKLENIKESDYDYVKIIDKFNLIMAGKALELQDDHPIYNTKIRQQLIITCFQQIIQ
jgi:hypothetical protein